MRGNVQVGVLCTSRKILDLDPLFSSKFTPNHVSGADKALGTHFAGINLDNKRSITIQWKTFH